MAARTMSSLDSKTWMRLEILGSSTDPRTSSHSTPKELPRTVTKRTIRNGQGERQEVASAQAHKKEIARRKSKETTQVMRNIITTVAWTDDMNLSTASSNDEDDDADDDDSSGASHFFRDDAMEAAPYGRFFRCSVSDMNERPPIMFVTLPTYHDASSSPLKPCGTFRYEHITCSNEDDQDTVSGHTSHEETSSWSWHSSIIKKVDSDDSSCESLDYSTVSEEEKLGAEYFESDARRNNLSFAYAQNDTDANSSDSQRKDMHLRLRRLEAEEVDALRRDLEGEQESDQGCLKLPILGKFFQLLRSTNTCKRNALITPSNEC